ncbi:MAG: A24 family peptidase [Gammaproteobacteria bacterium]|nr:A24 family peptidase [Gammaproteobacteria bacterium]
MAFIELLESSLPLFLFAVGLFGLCVGSFLNVVIFRLPKMLQQQWIEQCNELLNPDVDVDSESDSKKEKFNLLTPASTCRNCGHKITALENIPVISYIFLRGRCANCKDKVSLRYPIVELLTAILSIVVALHFGVTWQCATALLLTWSLVALSFIDFDHQILPDVITLPFLWLGLLGNLFGLFTDVQSAVIGAAAGYLSLWLVYHAFKLLTGKEGMGFGDFKLLGLFGAWFGWQLLPLVILLSAFSGAVIGIALIVLRGRDRNIPIPFGPYLAIAGWIAMLWGEKVIDSYLQIAGIA